MQSAYLRSRFHLAARKKKGKLGKFAGKNILSVSTRLLNYLKRWGLVTPKAFGAEPNNPIAIGSTYDSY
jgi:hypothetical protein